MVVGTVRLGALRPAEVAGVGRLSSTKVTTWTPTAKGPE